MSTLRLLHLTPSIGKASFGLGQVAVNLAKAQNDLSADAKIWSLDPEEQIHWATEMSNLDREKVKAFPLFGPEKLRFSHVMLSAAKSDGANFDIVHQHGLWTACSYVNNTLCQNHSVPAVVAPHGSLDAWALKRSMNKKHLALFLYERKNLNNASCLHALSKREAEGFRGFGLRNPIAIIPNGISSDWISNTADKQVFRSRFGISADTKIMLYLGRITPKKGLPLLLRAMDRLRESLVDWKLFVAGVDEFNHLQELEAMVKKFTLEQYVHFIGPQFDQEKFDAFTAADLFVLPSYSEGAPMTILEALGVGTPVLTTKASPCEYLVTHQCGWWTDASVDAIAESLGEALNKPREILREMGRRGKDLVTEEYTWNMIAKQTMKLYDWLLGRSQRPNFVIED